MSDPNQAEFRKKLDEFSERLRVRTEEFRKQGEFSDTHQALLNQIRQRNDALRNKVAEAEQKGTTWDLMKTEFVRDYSSLFDDMLEFEDRLDTAAANQGKN
jgi:hypothetical protein